MQLRAGTGQEGSGGWSQSVGQWQQEPMVPLVVSVNAFHDFVGTTCSVMAGISTGIIPIDPILCGHPCWHCAGSGNPICICTVLLLP